MGQLLKQIRKDRMLAMKEHDSLKDGVLSLLLSSLALSEKEKGSELTESEEEAIVQRELKQTKEALELTPDSRQDLIDENKKKIALILSYLPKQMDEAEIKKAIDEIVQDKNIELTKKSQGIIMKEMMSKYKGKVDGKSVNKVLSTLLK